MSKRIVSTVQRWLSLLLLMLLLLPNATPLFAQTPDAADSDVTAAEMADAATFYGHEFPYRIRQVDVSDYFTEANLRFDPVQNPMGLFTSADDDTSSASDAQARQELVRLGQRNRPSYIRYVDIGDPNADPIVLFHGLPTSMYLYRNIIPHLTSGNRVIAFDQIGMGLSSKHDRPSYTYKQHLAYVEAFFQALGLDQKKATLVLHDTGGTLGFAYAARHPAQIKGLVFFETAYGPGPSLDVFPPVLAFWRSAEGNRQILQENIMVEMAIVNSSQISPPANVPFTVQPLSDRAIRVYQRPYQRPANRQVLAQFVREIPVVGGAPDGFGDTNLALWSQFAGYLVTSDVPKLFFYVEPGFANPPPVSDFVKANLNVNNSLQSINLGFGYHYLQEDFPNEIGQGISQWLFGLATHSATDTTQNNAGQEEVTATTLYLPVISR